MNRVLHCLVLAVTSSLSGAAVRGQQATRASDSGILARNFSSAYLKASDAYDSFGFSVALNADGTTLAVSTTREGSAARGVNGTRTVRR